MTRDGHRPTLWAISYLHTGHTGNKPVTESLHPASPEDWLIVAGDVAERTDEIHWSLDLLRKRFAKVIWVPGNHELWTTNNDPMQIYAAYLNRFGTGDADAPTLTPLAMVRSLLELEFPRSRSA